MRFNCTVRLLLDDLLFVRLDDILGNIPRLKSQCDIWSTTHTLIIIISVDRNKVGLAAGSRTVEDDWNDWKRPAILRDIAKLFRKSTYVSGFSVGATTFKSIRRTRFDIAVLNRTSISAQPIKGLVTLDDTCR